MSEPLARAGLMNARVDHFRFSAASPQSLLPGQRSCRFLGRNAISNRQTPQVETEVTYSKERTGAASNRQKSRLLGTQL
jgi:hypothetical protein